ncbi:AcrR family transcriptional regulator [Streptomyces griseochromogenes]|uniref:AcrR family transcriptional regulator n=1 Tax=Streptomyces griseochromogenes TaxID=68214 RepID=A0A1B1B2Y8_9ACTN|nr:TetR/AcrR family transcriptional regulator [Streptomyces griseochromogenes]ANP53188.1 TetR family transcriptional regulator [Streptomyces griseochromogenes]MBP2053884.1 AcrR family transcriptional regulator [Streptomyces griseochromogenes]
MAAGAASPRERYRSQVRAEIKAKAREQIATAGASGLSLNAIAKEMGMSGPALYRYFGGRDDLITELVRDGYRSLADTFRTAADAGSDLSGLAGALRRWALEDPQRYFLVYGTPVPGYRAPDDITAIAQEIMAALLDVCAAEEPGPATPDTLASHLADHRRWAGDHPAAAPVLRRALAFWTRLHGVLSLELAGHFTGMGFDPELLFAAEVEGLAGRG